jgi:hypothetical protein
MARPVVTHLTRPFAESLLWNLSINDLTLGGRVDWRVQSSVDGARD